PESGAPLRLAVPLPVPEHADHELPAPDGGPNSCAAPTADHARSVHGRAGQPVVPRQPGQPIPVSRAGVARSLGVSPGPGDGRAAAPTHPCARTRHSPRGSPDVSANRSAECVRWRPDCGVDPSFGPSGMFWMFWILSTGALHLFVSASQI